MNIYRFKQFAAAFALSGILSLTITPLATAASSVATTSGSSSTSKSTGCTESKPPTTLAGLKNCGNSLITGRLTAITKMSGKLSAMVDVTASDKAALNKTLSDDQSGLKALNTKLSSDTTITAAKADYLSIFSAYRIYMLVVPKINIVKVADNQQVNAKQLNDIITSLLVPILNDPNNGLSASDLAKAKALMSAAQQQLKLSQATAAKVETAVLALTPKDYNSDHTVMQQDYQALVKAQSQLVNAYNDLNSLTKLPSPQG